MAGNTRGRIKEHLEGCHKNYEWIKVHLEATTILIQEHNPKLKSGIEGVAKANAMLDESLLKIYSVI